MNLFFVNLEGVRLIRIDDETVVPEVHVEFEREDVGCPTCGAVAVVKDRRLVPLVDLTMIGRKFVLVWKKRRFACRESECPTDTWTEVDDRMAVPAQDDRSRGSLGHLRCGQERSHPRRGRRSTWAAPGTR